MIRVTELHGRYRFINVDLIEYIEANPDTQIVMRDGRRVFVRENPEQIVDLVVAFRQRCNQAVSAIAIAPTPVAKTG